MRKSDFGGDIMNKKTAVIFSRFLIIAIFIVFEIVMYYAVGEEILLQKGPIRILWLVLTFLIPNLTFLSDFIINKIYKNKEKK